MNLATTARATTVLLAVIGLLAVFAVSADAVGRV
jgi:hypothetical protein